MLSANGTTYINWTTSGQHGFFADVMIDFVFVPFTKWRETGKSVKVYIHQWVVLTVNTNVCRMLVYTE